MVQAEQDVGPDDPRVRPRVEQVLPPIRKDNPLAPWSPQQFVESDELVLAEVLSFVEEALLAAQAVRAASLGR